MAFKPPDYPLNVFFGRGHTCRDVRCAGYLPERSRTWIDSVQLTGMPRRDVDIAITVYQKNGNLYASHRGARRGLPKIKTATDLRVQLTSVDERPKQKARKP